MAAPNRKAEVIAIANRYPQAFGAPDETLDVRRRLLIPIIVDELNKIDGPDKWRLLYREDRQDEDPKPGRLTSDVVVWTADKTHYDVLSSSGGMWGAHPAITDPDWKIVTTEGFATWDDGPTDPPPPPPPPDPPIPPPPTDIPALLARVAALESALLTTREELAATHIAIEAALDEIEAGVVERINNIVLVVEGKTANSWGHSHNVRLITSKG